MLCSLGAEVEKNKDYTNNWSVFIFNIFDFICFGSVFQVYSKYKYDSVFGVVSFDFD